MITKIRTLKSVAGLLALGLLSACAGKGPLGGDPGLTVVSSAGLPFPERSDLSEAGRHYLISPFDKLSIDVFGISSLSGKEIQVDGAGMIAFPLAGSIKVSGMTPGELSERLRARLAEKAVRDPQVTVNISDVSGQLVTVDGAVVEPGLYPVANKMTLIRAVASAKGVTEFSDLEDVVVFRTVGGQRYAALYNMSAIRRGAYEDPKIFANDVVIVGDSPARRLFRDFLTVTPLLTTPLIVAFNGRR